MKTLPVRGLVTGLAFMLLDQAIKFAVTGPLGLHDLGDVRELLPIFNLNYVANRGVSLGFLHADTTTEQWALVAMTGAIAVGVMVWMWRERNRVDQMALGLILGGALGNIIDRARLGFVVDYADLHFGEWRPFLVFNAGDAFITVGVLVLLARALLVREGPRASVENSNA